MATKVNLQLPDDKPFKEQDFNIVIVDENATYRNQLASRLRMMGFYIEFATGGFHLMHILEKEGKNFHLVIVHNNMSDMSAYEMTGLIRTFKSKSELPILFISRSVSPEDLKELVTFGINDFYQKTNEQHKIAEKVQKFFAARKTAIAS